AVLFISNPNPPSGILYSRDEMERLCMTTNGIVVIDEAYVDFAECDCVPLLADYENLIITRTLSKSYSLAGMRVGFALASREIIEGMMKVKDSYNVDILSQTAAIAALEDQDYFRKNIARIREDREYLSSQLREIGFEVFPSQANFILVSPSGKSAREIYESLLQEKILVRFFDSDNMNRYLRITVGSKEENRKLLDAVRRHAG
ncbi:MAG: aminotransferase class I/II-fold pyridoxal phosphate-dependent enzyme, partial [Thermoplasmata archaeon]|nr:aminotransferase class I/II-fold pyridoxal phosphate-dependent enzyme [Thermoplasmata archaeon]